MIKIGTGILLLSIASVCVAVPFREIPPPIEGPSKLASLASEDELAREADYAKYKKDNLRKIYSRYVLGERKALSLGQLNEVYRLVMDATAVKVPQSLCILEPRHYFEYTSEYGKVEVLMCFECGEAIVNVNEWNTYRSLDRKYLTKLNAIFKKNDVPTPILK
jgi:hypothetical protein